MKRAFVIAFCVIIRQFFSVGNFACIEVFAIKEFFSYLKGKKNGNGKNNTISIAVLKEQFHEMKTNHLVHIDDKLEKLEKKQNRIMEIIIEIKTQLGNLLKK